MLHKIIPNFHNGGNPAKASNRLRFGKKFFSSTKKGYLFIAGIGDHRAIPYQRSASQILRIVFFDGYLHQQVKIQPYIGNAKPTLSQDLAHQVFSVKYGIR